MAILCAFLVVAPFRVWREQRQEIAELEQAQATTERQRDSLRAALNSRSTAPPPQENRPDNYRAMRAQLAFFVRQADSLVVRYAKGPAIPSGTELQAWTDRVRHYLRTSAPDPSYEVEFNSATEPDDEHAYYGGSQAPIALMKRKAVLVKFLEQLRRTS